MIRIALLYFTFSISAAAKLCAQQPQLVLVERLQLKGEIVAVGDGSVTVRDDNNNVHTMQIAAADDSAVALRHAGQLVRIAADVSVAGRASVDRLTPGAIVRLAAELNRSGRTKGEVSKLTLLPDRSVEKGIQPDQQPASSREFVQATVTGSVFRRRGNRLTLTVPNSEFTRLQRLTFSLADEPDVLIHSSDYRQAKPGDRVEQLSALRFDSGDVVIEKLVVVQSDESPQTATTDENALAKYSHLSDMPLPARDERSRHFLLHTDVSPRSAALLLDKLETMISLTSRYYGQPPNNIIECYVVRDIQGWPPETLPQSAAAKIQDGEGVTLSLRVGRQAKSVVYACDNHGVVQHEAVHAYCSQTFGGTGPTWYSEGMAEMGHYWKEDQLAVQIPVAAVHVLGKSPPMTMAEIVRTDQITGDSWQAYQWRWALCHLLANNPNYHQQFKRLGLGMMTGDSHATFENAFGPVASQISFEYHQFIEHLDNGYRVDLAAWDWNSPWRPLQSGSRATVTVVARRGWQPTGVYVQRGDKFEFSAEGRWKLTAQASAVAADGNDNGEGQLVGVIMREFRLGDPFPLGAIGKFSAAADGNLYVRCKDRFVELADNSGEIKLLMRSGDD